MIMETVFPMMSVVWGTKNMHHRAWDGFEARLAYTMAAFNILNGGWATTATAYDGRGNDNTAYCRCATTLKPRYLSTGYWLEVPKSQKSGSQVA